MLLNYPAPQAKALTAGGVFQALLGGNDLINAPGSNRLEGVPFNVRASGYVTLPKGTYTSTVTVALYANGVLGATPNASNVVATAAGAIVVASAAAVSVPFYVGLGRAQGNTAFGSLQGLEQSMLNGVLAADSDIDQPPTGLDFAAEPSIQFAVKASASATDITGGVLSAFYLES